MPRPIDKGKPSGADGSKMSPKDACDLVGRLTKAEPPLGTATIVVEDIEAIEPLVDDSSPTRNNPHHTHIDFNPAEEETWLDLSEDLADSAEVTYLAKK
jgi:hypothetical protein